MKVTDDKKQLAMEWYEKGLYTAYEIAVELHTTRATVYRWLKSEGVEVARRKPSKPETELKKLAAKFGVSLPTARKYMTVVNAAEIAEKITPDDFRKIGFSETQQKIVVAFLEKSGYVYNAEGMTLWNAKDFEVRQLTVQEVVGLFLDPVRFVNES